METTIRLWHQSLTVLEDVPAYAQTLRDHIRRVSGPRTEVILHGMRARTYRSHYPGGDIKYLYFQYLHAQQILENVRRAEADGYDAFVLCTLPDTGLEIARTLTDIPTVGMGFASMHTAAYLGRRFGIVCFISELISLYAANAERYGLGALAGPVRHLGLSFDDVFRGFEQPGPVVDAFQRAVRALAVEGVDVVIPGEAVLGVLLARERVQRVDEVPVVDTVATAVKMAEALVELQRSSGMGITRRGYFYAKPPEQRVGELVELYRSAVAEA